MIKIESSNDNQEKSVPRRRKFRRAILIPTTLVALIALIGVTYLTMHYTSQPSFCASCHEIRTAVTSWEVGPHKSVTCLDCHSNPGKVGYVIRKFRGLGEVYLHVTNKVPTTLVAKYNTETCIVCHTGNNTEYPEAKNLNSPPGEMLAPAFSHTEILQNDTSCLVCHLHVGHGEAQ